MDRHAILMDAGYFFAAGGAALQPKTERVRRTSIALRDPKSLLTELQMLVATICNASTLLRMYWYDAPPHGLHPSGEQESIGRLPGVKLRLGNLNHQGEQKGVDSLIITDLIDLARNSAVSDVVLVSGDEDLRVGVSVAQSYGVRVHLLGIGDAPNNTSPRLLMESDGQVVADCDWLKNILEIRPAATTIHPGATAFQAWDPMTQVPLTARSPSLVDAEFLALAEKTVEGLLSTRTPSELAGLKVLLTGPTPLVPPDLDGKCLARIGAALGRRLERNETSLVRKLFRVKITE